MKICDEHFDLSNLKKAFLYLGLLPIKTILQENKIQVAKQLSYVCLAPSKE